MLEGYKSIHEIRGNRRGRGLCIFVQDSLPMKVRDDLSDISDAVDFLSDEIENKLPKYIILSLGYRPPNGDSLMFEKQLRNIFSKNSITNKIVTLTDDFNINLLDFKTNKQTLSISCLVLESYQLYTK